MEIVSGGVGCKVQEYMEGVLVEHGADLEVMECVVWVVQIGMEWKISIYNED